MWWHLPRQKWRKTHLHPPRCENLQVWDYEMLRNARPEFWRSMSSLLPFQLTEWNFMILQSRNSSETSPAWSFLLGWSSSLTLTGYPVSFVAVATWHLWMQSCVNFGAAMSKSTLLTRYSRCSEMAKLIFPSCCRCIPIPMREGATKNSRCGSWARTAFLAVEPKVFCRKRKTRFHWRGLAWEWTSLATPGAISSCLLACCESSSRKGLKFLTTLCWLMRKTWQSYLTLGCPMLMEQSPSVAATWGQRVTYLR